MIQLLAFIVTIGLLVTIHEYGHFIVARWFDVKVLRFSIGFGKAIYKRTFGQDNTELVIAAIPLGGYVKMLDENAMAEEGQPASYSEADLARSYNRQSVYKRIAIVLAGPIFNLLLAILIYWVTFSSGVWAAKPYVAMPANGTPAAIAGIQAGGLITAADDAAIKSWQELRWYVMEQTGSDKPIELTLFDSEQHTQRYSLSMSEFDSENVDVDPLAQLGLAPFQEVLPAVIGPLLDDGAAKLAGLQPKDRVLTVNGASVENWMQFVEIVQSSPEKNLSLIVMRDDVRHAVELTPKAINQQEKVVGKIGAGVDYPESLKHKYLMKTDYSLSEALVEAVGKTWDTAWFSLKMLGKMLTGNVSWKMMSGPVTIADYAGQSANMGLKAFAGFLALMSISIGVLNLLPIPMLDGGHFMYYVIEILLGRPVPESVLLIGQKIGLALIGVMMMLAFYNDINRLVSG